jgi:hypothetical protein
MAEVVEVVQSTLLAREFPLQSNEGEHREDDQGEAGNT